jgi:hypothetical protein
MTTISIEVGPEMFRFHSKQHWVAKGRDWFKAAGVQLEDFICVDTKGRVCRYGLHFRRAEEDGAYPIVVYRHEKDGDG